jgi:protein-ribulosamine 3-kinase
MALVDVKEIEAFVSRKMGRRWEACGSPIDSSGRRPAHIVRGTDFSVFVKYAIGPDAAAKATCEQNALERLSTLAHVRAPDVIGTLDVPGASALVMVAIEPTTPTTKDWARLGEMVAALHRESSDHFGLGGNNFIGDFPQTNSWMNDWNEFFVNNRVRPMLMRAVETGHMLPYEIAQIENTLAKIDEISGKQCSPSLLHGDLWKGNVLFDSRGPILIDPAISYGNREMDMAFGLMASHLRFDDAFYEAYSSTWPLAAGYEYRQSLWQMWPLLTHVVQDGRRWVQPLMKGLEKYQ